MTARPITRRGFLKRSFAIPAVSMLAPAGRSFAAGPMTARSMKAYAVKELRVQVAGADAVTAMVRGDDGLVYCGLTGKRRALAPKDAPVKTDGCYLMRYDPERRVFERTAIEATTGPFRNVSPAKNKSWNNGFDSACCARDGTVWFGTSLPANLCRLKPGAAKVGLLCRPVRTSRIPALAEAADGRLLGFGGFPQMQFFAYAPEKRSLVNHGVVAPHYDLCLFHAMVALPDGRIYAGETDSGRASVHCLTPRVL